MARLSVLAFVLVLAFVRAGAVATPAAASRIQVPFVPAGGAGKVGEVLLSERAAAALGVQKGDTIDAAPTAAFDAPERYVVAGVYRPDADPVEVGRDSRYARFHVDDLERLSGQRDRVQRFVIRLADPARALAVRDRLARGAVGFDVYTSQDLADRASGTFVVISRFQRAIAWLALAAGSVFLVTLMVLKVEERRRELASLTLMGISRRTVLTSLALESLVIALAGGALGALLGLLASSGINAYFQRYYQTALVFSRVSPGVVVTAVALALPLGVAAAAVAAWRLLKTRGLTGRAMIAFLARRNLVRQRARTLLCVLGLAVSTALLYDMALLASGLKASLARVLEEVGYDVRVLPKGGLPFSSDAVLPHGSSLAAGLARVPGADALPLWATTLYLEPARGGGRATSAFALGLDPARQTLYRVVRGHAIAPHGEGSGAAPVVLNERLARALGAAPGDTLLAAAALDATLGGAARRVPLVVVGTGEFRFDLHTQRSLALAPADLARIAGRDDDPASFLLGRLAPGASGRAVAARWALLHPETEFHEVSEMLSEVRGQLSYFQQFSLILGTVSLLVTFLLVLTLQTLSVNERQGEIAILRALGLKAPRVVALVLVEGLALALLALPAGIALGTFAARGLDAILTSSPGLPTGLSFFVFTPGALARTALLVVVTATLAGAYPAWLAARTNVALTLHREVT